MVQPNPVSGKISLPLSNEISGHVERRRPRNVPVFRKFAQRATNAENSQSKDRRDQAEDVIDARIMRKLYESGFIDRAYAAQGVRVK
jgi:hypothetical protein